MLDIDKDKRSGLSIIIRPPDKMIKVYRHLVSEFRKIEPRQYYYPFPDLHITVFDLIAVHESFDPENCQLTDYLSVANTICTGELPVPIAFNGIVFSNAAGLIMGFDNNRLVNLRKKIRTKLKNEGIPVKERYESKTAHITFCRFLKKLNHPRQFLQKIDKMKGVFFGSYTFDHIEVVIHNWYNRSKKCTIIKRIDLI